ncbi:hypothetical protein RclHR1_11800008 [Rhizophagus clarus]|uniref:DDE-1 domain-containing protein n=1 Tax=Rhizophagus clarus TaxID=94130 RepID=A0A2Z6Q9Q5_9GLOM|nr:hypothetical protein RclHR1_11800008 [Rhizophagus clarus]
MYYESGHSKRSIADKFNIQPKQLCKWINNKEKLLNAAPYTQRLNTGARLKYPYLEVELIEWVKEARSQLKTSGTKTVLILSTGYERLNFTVVLACMADGTKLPPVIIFKLKNISREVFPDGVIICTNPEVLDSFSAHKTDVVKQRFCEKKTDLAVIPGGLTSRLQLLNVSLNMSFKAKVRNLYNNWMSKAIKDYTPSGKIKRPFYSLVASWVKEGWDAIDTSMIRRSFKCCGILNATDRTEDTLIFDFNQLESKINRENLGREVEKDGENNDKENESESEGNDRNELEDDESELKDNYYEENEEQTVIQDWS